MAGSADTANIKDEGPRHLAGTKRRSSEVIAAPRLTLARADRGHLWAEGSWLDDYVSFSAFRPARRPKT